MGNYVEQIKKRIEHPAPAILQSVGKLLVAQSQRAFREQALGEIHWPARYPNQRAPKINIAGAVEDLRTGPRVKTRRFQDRPALFDTATLSRSISFRVVDPVTVEYGTTIEYANRMQKGGKSVQVIDATVKKNLAKFLRPPGGGRGPRGGARQQGKKSSGIGHMFRDKLGPLFRKTQLITNAVPRPFVGVTDETKREIVRTLQQDLPK